MQDNFPFHADLPYRPRKADLHDLMRFEKGLGIDHVCLICMSVYGDDNRSILDALRRLHGGGRAVVCIDPTTITENELAEMHRLGVRGVRVNLRTRNEQTTVDELMEKLRKYVDRVQVYSWVIQVYLAMYQIPMLAKALEELNGKFVIDHLGSPDENIAPQDQQGYAELMDLLRRKSVWVKLSGTYRFPKLPSLHQYVREILQTAPTQVVWASDWPHSGGVDYNPNGDRHQHQEYRQVDDVGFLRQCLEWCGRDQNLIRLLFVDNPCRLWGA
jgi:predicted TIM-barrel fold metal-dependent hydrolase